MASCTWVCASCAQHFTRRYTANRHNTNLHDGKGIIVRILDYLVGRVSGQYLPNDPLEYRRERQNEKNGTSLDSHNKRKNFWSKAIADSTNDITSDRSKTSLLSNNDIESSYPGLLSHPPRKSDNKDSIGESIRTNLKLEEFKYLVNNYFSPENASTILGLTAYHFSQGNDDFFEKSLLFLRELHGTSFDNSTTRRASLEITYPHGIDPNLSLQKPENKDPAAEQMQAKHKLSEIEEVLRPFCHPEYIQKVINRLIEECNRTGDYDILDEALENHRNIVRRFYLRR